MYDASSIESINWDMRRLVDSTNNLVLNWNNRQLLNSGSLATVDWETLTLTDSSSALSIDWGARQLKAGGVIKMDWSSVILFSAASSYGARVNILANSTTEKGIAIRNVASSTANYLELQNSAGTSLASFNQNASLILRAGSTTAATAPIYWTSGNLLTSAVVGAMEFLTDKWYGTPTAGTRKEFTMNDIALTSGRVPVVASNGYLTDSANLTYNTSSKQLSLTITTAANLGYVVKGAASQTGDYWQAQNSSSTVLNRINSSGWIGIGTTAAPASEIHIQSASNPAFTLTTGTYASGKDAMFFGLVTSANAFCNNSVAGDTAILGKAGGILHLCTSASTGTAQASVLQIAGNGGLTQVATGVQNTFNSTIYSSFYTTQNNFVTNGNGASYMGIRASGDGTNSSLNF
jgi:hypothetical protein